MKHPLVTKNRVGVVAACLLALLMAVAVCGGEEDAGPAASAPAAPAAAPTAAAVTGSASAPRSQATTAPAAAPEGGAVMAAPVAPPTGPGSWAPPTAALSPSGAVFRDYRQSGFAPSAEDNVSTFSLDTDRTSFRLALNWVQAGHDVDPDSVRAEEWVNAFDYGYPQPAHDDSFAITTGLLAHPLEERLHLVRIGFQAPEFRDGAPLNVTLVLDASGSMAQGGRVDIARAAAHAIRGSLDADDRIAVVLFSETAPREWVTEHRAPRDRAVRGLIDRLAPHASTNVQAGLNAGVQLAHRARQERPEAHNYVILMSDGVANVDATDPFAILESAYDAGSRNPLRLITIGVGIENYNDVLLEQLAQHGNGWYRYLSSPDEAEALFSRESWLALSIPFADQTRAQVTWDPEVVEEWRLVGYENRVTADANFTQDRKEFAEIPMGAATTVFYEVRLRPGAAAAALGDVHLRWVTPGSGLTNRQAAALAPAGSRGDDPLLSFGATVALAADRYASLPSAGAGRSGAGHDLAALYARLQGLEAPLGHLPAYRDFAAVLERLAGGLPEGGGAPTSGYSR